MQEPTPEQIAGHDKMVEERRKMCFEVLSDIEKKKEIQSKKKQSKK